MRLPVSKIYRAFPELDRIDDDACEVYIERAKARNRLRTSCGGAVAGAIFVLFVGAAIWLMIILLLHLPRGPRSEFWNLALIGTEFGVMMLLGCVFSFLARDYFLRRLLRWELQGAQCPNCGYSMLGLRAKDGKIVCPECGEVRDFEAMGLTPQDLMAETDEW